MTRHSRLTALGVVLCLLVTLFALEAKIAWFSPAGSAGAQISAAKARPAEQPKSLPVRLTWHDGHAHDFSVIPTLLASFLLLFVTAIVVDASAPNQIQATISSGFDPTRFFRPPPSI